MPAIFRCRGYTPRRLIYLPLIFFGLFSMSGTRAVAQNAERYSNAVLRLNEVNSRAARHFLNHFSSASEVIWSRDKKFYVARFVSSNSTTRVYYRSNGNFDFCLKYYLDDGLNGDLKSAILKRFPGCQITTITEVTDLEKKEFYVNIRIGANIEILRCNEEGIEVMGNIKNAGI